MENNNILNNVSGETLTSSDHHFGHLKVYKEYEPSRNQYCESFESFEKQLIINWNNVVKHNDLIVHLGDFAINKHNSSGNKKKITVLDNIISSNNIKKDLDYYINTLQRKFNPSYFDNLTNISNNSKDILNDLIKYKNTFNGIKSKKHISNSLNNLNGSKILIKGNHDKYDNDFYLDAGFDYVIGNEIVIVNENSSIEIIKLPSNLNYCGALIKNVNGKKIMFSHFRIFGSSEKYDEKVRYYDEHVYLTKLFYELKCDINMHGHTHSLEDKSFETESACVEIHDFTPVSIENLIKKNNLRRN